MKAGRTCWIAALAAALLAGPAMGAPAYLWEMAGDMGSLSQSIANDDLINGKMPLLNPDLSYAGDPVLEYPFGPNHWDPVTNPNGFHPINNLGDPCQQTTQPDFRRVPFENAGVFISGFHYAFPEIQDGARLTDGIEGSKTDSVLRDLCYPSAIVQYNFDTPTDIGEIRVFSANSDLNARAFQNYDVAVSTDDVSVNPRNRNFTDLIINVISADPVGDPPTGYWPNSDPPGEKFPGDPDAPYPLVGATLTRVIDDSSPTLAAGVTSIRFYFWAVSNTANALWDPFLADIDCPGATKDPWDVDGFKRAFEASIIKEIDVFAPAGPPCNTPAQDVDGDGDVDLSDFAGFLACFNGPNRPWPGPPVNQQSCQCLDSDTDSDVDLADFGKFLSCFNGPARPPAAACLVN